MITRDTARSCPAGKSQLVPAAQIDDSELEWPAPEQPEQTAGRDPAGRCTAPSDHAGRASERDEEYV